MRDSLDEKEAIYTEGTSPVGAAQAVGARRRAPPAEAKAAGLRYFLEVGVAKDAVDVWSVWRDGTEATLQVKTPTAISCYARHQPRYLPSGPTEHPPTFPRDREQRRVERALCPSASVVAGQSSTRPAAVVWRPIASTAAASTPIALCDRDRVQPPPSRRRPPRRRDRARVCGSSSGRGSVRSTWSCQVHLEALLTEPLAERLRQASRNEQVAGSAARSLLSRTSTARDHAARVACPPKKNPAPTMANRRAPR